MKSRVDKYLREAKHWPAEIAKLRSVILTTDLEENVKWNLPCYSYGGHNVAIIQPFKSCLALMFFKGSLLKDPKGLLIDNGPNSQAGRRFEFRSQREILKLASTIKAYIREAIALEKSGHKVAFKKNPEPMPIELKRAFAKAPALKKAFSSLTPGRQRAYILHFSGAKQSSTRQARIEKHASRILAGKGIGDR